MSTAISMASSPTRLTKIIKLYLNASTEIPLDSGYVALIHLTNESWNRIFCSPVNNSHWKFVCGLKISTKYFRSEYKVRCSIFHRRNRKKAATNWVDESIIMKWIELLLKIHKQLSVLIGHMTLNVSWALEKRHSTLKRYRVLPTGVTIIHQRANNKLI